MYKLILLVTSCALLSNAQTSADALLMNQASGTSMNPDSWAMPMKMKMIGDWSLMFMGQAFIVDVQQSGPRGADKLYSPNYGMISAQRSLGGGAIMLQSMISLEPATVTQRRYPELFQTGETAFGKPITDGQHPHNFVMGLSVQYAHPLGDHTIAQIYFAPVGDPALGPVAFPHRASAEELPQATLSHHWQDSTHIANDVVTVALQHKKVRLEASGFHGTEPNENRWTIGYGAINSWATRFSVFPTRNWMAQVSVGHLTQPERQELTDVIRTTASLHYTRGGWSTSFIWGRNHKTLDKADTDAYLIETVAPIGRKNFVTGRAEWVDKDELLGFPFRVGAYTSGYTRDIGTFQNVQTGIGANLTAYAVPAAAQSAYGVHPMSVSVFLRFRLHPGQ